jgi:hypothetical protein
MYKNMFYQEKSLENDKVKVLPYDIHVLIHMIISFSDEKFVLSKDERHIS